MPSSPSVEGATWDIRTPTISVKVTLTYSPRGKVTVAKRQTRDGRREVAVIARYPGGFIASRGGYQHVAADRSFPSRWPPSRRVPWGGRCGSRPPGRERRRERRRRERETGSPLSHLVRTSTCWGCTTFLYNLVNFFITFVPFFSRRQVHAPLGEFS